MDAFATWLLRLHVHPDIPAHGSEPSYFPLLYDRQTPSSDSVPVLVAWRTSAERLCSSRPSCQLTPAVAMSVCGTPASPNVARDDETEGLLAPDGSDTGKTPIVRPAEARLLDSRLLLKEAALQCQLAMPTWITQLLTQSIGHCSVFTLARLGTTELNAASLAVITLATFCVAPIVYGLGTALDTLASQAYTSSNPRTTSLYVQRTGLLMLAAFVPSAGVLTFSESLLLAIKQDAQVAALAGRFIRGKFSGTDVKGDHARSRVC